MAKRILSFLLAFVMLFSLTAQGFAENDGGEDGGEATATVTFNANGGYFDEDPEKTEIEYVVSAGQIIDTYPTPRCADNALVFVGWYLDDECLDGPIDLASYVPEDGVTLYAGWESQITVTFDANGGFFADTGESQNTVTIRMGELLPEIEDPCPSEEYMLFNGWYDDAGCCGDPIDLSVFVPQQDMFLYAGWRLPGVDTENYLDRYTLLNCYYDGWTVHDNELGIDIPITAEEFAIVFCQNTNVKFYAVPADDDPILAILTENADSVYKVDGFDFLFSGAMTLELPEGLVFPPAFWIDNPEADITIIRHDNGSSNIQMPAGKLQYYGNIGELRLWSSGGSENGCATIYGNIRTVSWNGPSIGEEHMPYYGSLYVQGTIENGFERGMQTFDLTDEKIGVVEFDFASKSFTLDSPDELVCVIDQGELAIPSEEVFITTDDLSYDYNAQMKADGSFDWTVAVTESVQLSTAVAELPDDFTAEDLLHGEKVRVNIHGGYPMEEPIELTGDIQIVEVSDADVHLSGGSIYNLILSSTYIKRNQSGFPYTTVVIDDHVEILGMIGPMDHVAVDLGSEGFIQDGQWSTYQLGSMYDRSTRYFSSVVGDMRIMDHGALKVMSYDEAGGYGAIMPSSEELSDAAGIESDDQAAYMYVTSNHDDLTPDEIEAIQEAIGQEDFDDASAVDINVYSLTFSDSGEVEDSDQLSELNDSVPVILETPSNDEGDPDYVVVRLHENENGDLDGEVIAEADPNSTVTVYSEKYSKFLIIDKNGTSVQDGFTVTFDANGGYFYDDPTMLQYQESFAAGDCIYDWTAPQHSDSHMCFSGWYWDALCSNGPVELGETYPTGDVTLYACWAPAYIVTYDANGGYFSGATPETVRSDKVQLGNAAFYVDDPIIEDETLIFAGWYQDPSGGERVYPWENMYRQDVTFYAHWATRVTVNFDANGGYFDSEDNTFITFEAALGQPVHNNYYPNHSDEHMVFAGWYLDEECEEYPIDDVYNFVLVSGVTFFAKWMPAYIFTYDANGGYFWGNPDEKTYSDRFAIGTNPYGVSEPTYPEDAMAFSGWYMDPECSGERLYPWDNTYDTDTTVYAGWSAGCVVTFDANGGYFYNDPEITQYTRRFAVGDYIYVNDEPMHGDDHLCFSGWYWDAACSNGPVSLGDTYLTEDVTLYACWAPAYIVTYDANGGFFYGDLGIRVISVKTQLGDAAPYVEAPDSMDETLIFAGWYDNPECSGERVWPWENMYREDVTFYARWVASITVTFEANGGYFDSEDNTFITFEAALGQPLHNDFYPNHSDDHMAFTGWYLDAECSGEPITNISAFVPTEDITFYAGWTTGYKVTFDANGGFFDNGESTLFTVVIPGNRLENFLYPYSDDPRFTFSGWYLDPGCTGEEIDVLYYTINGDVTFYAKWTRGYIVTFDANGRVFESDENSVTHDEVVAKGYGINGDNWFIYNFSEGMMVSGWYFEPECENLAMKYNRWFTPTGDITLYAKWSEFYTVTYNANGGYFYGAYENTEEEYFIPKGNVLESMPGDPQIDNGLVFTGWYLDPDCSGDPVDPWGYQVNGSITFYAGWEEPIVVTFDANGGYFPEEGNVTQYSVDVTPGGMIYDSPYCVHSNERKEFDGWYLYPDCSGERIYPYGYSPTENITLYAKWSDCYIITFLPGDDAYFSYAADLDKIEYKVIIGQTASFGRTVISEIPHRVHKGFWQTEDGTVYNGEKFVPESDMTLYPKWEIAYSVTFIGNGGVFNSGESTMTISVADGDAIGYRLIGWENITPHYDDESKIFDYWSFDENGNDSVFLIAGFVPTGDTTLYANWANCCHASFYDVSDGRLIYRQFVKQGGYCSDVIDDYTFYLDSEMTQPVNPATYPITEDISFYGVHTVTGTASITLDLNGGLYGSDDHLVTSANIGWPYDSCSDSYYLLGSFTNNYKNGNKLFCGWSLTPEGDEPVDLNSPVPGDVTLFAIWKDKGLVTFVGNGQTLYSETDHGYYSGETITIELPLGEPLLSVIPEIQNHSLQVGGSRIVNEGWYYDRDCSQRVFETDLVRDGMTVYANWVSAYQVIVDFNGVFDYNFYYTTYYRYVIPGEALGEYPPVPDVPCDGAVFVGFALDRAGTQMIDDIKVFVPTDDVTIFAIWTKGYTVYLDGNGRPLFKNSNIYYTYYDIPIGEPVGAFEGPDGRYAIEGWYYDAECTQSVGDLNSFVPNRDLTIYAKWISVNPFADVKEGKYYYEPVLWAFYHDPQITGGVDATHFGPNRTCNREQIVTFLWKAFGAPTPTSTENPFVDVKAGKYYTTAVLWAVEQGITGGIDETHFGVGKACTREMAMTFLWVAAGRPMPSSSNNPFSDVKAGKYYTNAVLWAVENGITGGVEEGKFGVGQACTRAQIVTFLYKAMGN